MKIAVAGTGYVGLSVALLLSQHNEVHALDIVPEKVELLNNGKSPIVDSEVTAFLDADQSGERPLDFQATLDPAKLDEEVRRRQGRDTAAVELQQVQAAHRAADAPQEVDDHTPSEDQEDRPRGPGEEERGRHDARHDAHRGRGRQEDHPEGDHTNGHRAEPSPPEVEAVGVN